MELMDERNNSENHNLEKEIKDIEKSLSKIYKEKAKGAQIRSREKWVEFWEKNNSYFLGLEKKRKVKTSINKLKGEDGEVITNQENLLHKIKKISMKTCIM